MRTLKIIDQLPLDAQPSVSVKNTWFMWGARAYRYTKRPDGSWYEISYLFGDGTGTNIDNLIQSGMEPYQAFEVLAL